MELNLQEQIDYLHELVSHTEITESTFHNLTGTFAPSQIQIGDLGFFNIDINEDIDDVLPRWYLNLQYVEDNVSNLWSGEHLISGIHIKDAVASALKNLLSNSPDGTQLPNIFRQKYSVNHRNQLLETLMKMRSKDYSDAKARQMMERN